MNWEIRIDWSAQLHIKQLVGSSAWCSDNLEGWDQGWREVQEVGYIWLMHFVIWQKVTL